MRKLAAITVMSVMGLAALGCGESSGPEEGSFEVTVSGDMEFSFSGEAIFGVSSEGGVDRWMIFLLNGQFLGLDYDMVGFSREASDAPIPVGTHTILDAASDALDDEDIVAAYMIGRHNGSLGVYSSVSGTLTIASADSERIVGSFDFSSTMQIAVGSDVRDVNDLTFSGSFTAVAGTIPSGATSN